MSLLAATLLLQGLISDAVVADIDPLIAFDAVLSAWTNVMDKESSEYCEGIRTYDRMLGQLHHYVCQTSDHNVQEKRALLHRATDWMKMEKLAGDVYADGCIVPFASGGNGCFAGDYTGWPQGLGEYMYNLMHTT